MSNYTNNSQQQVQPTSPQPFLVQQQNIQAQHPQHIKLQPNTPYINNIPVNNSNSNNINSNNNTLPFIQHHLSIIQPIYQQPQPQPQQFYHTQPVVYTNQVPHTQPIIYTNQVQQQPAIYTNQVPYQQQVIYTNQVQQQQQVIMQPIKQQQQLQQKQIEQNNNNHIMESSFQGFLFKIKEKFEKFSSNHVGADNILFEEAPLPTHKECNYILLKLQYGRNIHTSLLPFTLPNDTYKPPEFFTKIDIIQFYLSGLASILVLMKLSQDQTFAKWIGIPLSKAKLMIEKLAKIFQQQLDSRNSGISNSVISNSVAGSNSNSSNSSSNENNSNSNSNTNTNLSLSITGGSNVLSSQRNNNPIIIYFNQQFEFIQQLKKYFENNEMTNECLVYFTQSLFSMLTNQGYFWYIGDELSKQLRATIFSKIYENLNTTVIRDPNETKFKYNFGCYCFSYFQICQKENQITSTRFVNFKSTLFKPPAKEEEIYNYLLFFLNLSNETLFKAFINPISDSYFWLIYAKTCCLLDQEEKAHTWIQYYINEATDRVTAASLIQLDSDIAHYRNKSWYIEIMKSIEDEKKKRIQEDDLLNRQKQQMQKQQQQQQQQLQQGDSPHIVGGQVQDQYSEIKTNLLLEGLVLKSMNHDATLISSNVLLNLHPPLQSKEVEIAQQRLNQRLELYMLKNSKEIPGDGNCQMHALSDQLHGDLAHSQEIRKKIVDWLRKNKDFSLPNGATICQFVNTNNWDDYCNDMSKNGNWGDHLTLLAAAELFGSKISIISSVESQSNFFIEIIPTKIRNDKVLLLSHYAEFHYGSLCPLRI